MIVGVDRLDYTKGLPERIAAFRNALQRYPELREKVILFQVVVPSREGVAEYQTLKGHIEQLVGEINGEFSSAGWVPIHYHYKSLPKRDLVSLYRMARICFVTSIKDGMNLVAKEFCACQVDGCGVLVLSEFAGAAAQLQEGALLVNPHDIEGMADALQEAMDMPEQERSERMETDADDRARAEHLLVGGLLPPRRPRDRAGRFPDTAGVRPADEFRREPDLACSGSRPRSPTGPRSNAVSLAGGRRSSSTTTAPSPPSPRGRSWRRCRRTTREVLRRLSERLPVAVLSGRGAGERRRPGRPGATWSTPGATASTSPRPASGTRWVTGSPSAIAQAAEESARGGWRRSPGVLIEPKRFAVSVHFRLAREEDLERIERAVDEVLAAHPACARAMARRSSSCGRTSTGTRAGRCSGCWARCASTTTAWSRCYVGDDVTDEDAFRAIRGRGIGILVTEEPRPTDAEYSLRDPGEVRDFLDWLAGGLTGGEVEAK